jgi:DNA-binding transcriptional regulator GbsR (MarR family)
MNSEEKKNLQKEIVEEIGRFFDKKGLQPIAGRIIGLLMVMDKERFTFDEIIDELNISKGSASTVLRTLELRGDIEIMTIPGDRKRYYQIKRSNIYEMFTRFEQELQTFKTIFQRILNLKRDHESKNALFFNDVIDVINFYLKHIQSFKEQSGQFSTDQ